MVGVVGGRLSRVARALFGFGLLEGCGHEALHDVSIYRRTLRYVLNAPDCDGEAPHGLRLVVGNGLRADVWTPFYNAFGVPRILEFYAATESNFSLYNVEGEPGAIGRIPAFLRIAFRSR